MLPGQRPFDRLVGLETEYAVRFSPREDGAPRPSNYLIFKAIRDAVESLVHVQRGERGFERSQFFTENGGAMCYEALPTAPEGGLVECATPECRGPSSLLLYQKAQEALLTRALPFAKASLAAQGFPGETALLKNCRDAEGHVYGAQENYEADIAGGPMLWLYRLGLVPIAAVAVPIALLHWAFAFAFLVPFIAILFVALFAAGFAPGTPFARSVQQLVEGRGHPFWRVFGRLWIVMELLLFAPLTIPFALLCRLAAFGRQRRAATAFLISRPAVTGAGTLRPDGSFELSEKGPDVKRVMRLSILPGDRPIFDIGNLMKLLVAPVHFRLRPLGALFRQKQRMQLGFSDSNMCQVAEFLKVGTTMLVLDMAESGFLADAPYPRRPIKALRTLIADPDLGAVIATRRHGTMNALQLQRWYLTKAREFLAQQSTVSLEARETLRLWTEVLDVLESGDTAPLVGMLDWVTKAALMAEGDRELSTAALKKIDLRYHELGDGYLARLEREGLAHTLVDPADVERALKEGPEDSPAQARGRLVRSLADSNRRVTVAWGSVRVGGRLRGEVIRLDRFRGE